MSKKGQAPLSPFMADTILASMRETCQWSDSDEETGEVDDYYMDNVGPLFRKAMRDRRVRQLAIELGSAALWDRFGHDLYLTARGAGCGFWDGDWDHIWSQEDIDYITEWCSNNWWG